MAKIIPLNERESIFDLNGLGTRRFNAFIRELTNQTNDTSAEVDTSVFIESLSLIADINNRIGSGDTLTSDTTGFTVDSDVLFSDMTEA